MNGDGRLDLAVANNHVPTVILGGGVTVLPGNGNGTFQSPLPLVRITDPSTSIAAGDLNGDGKPDIVVTTFVSVFGVAGSTLDVLIGDGSGLFTRSVISTGRTTRGSGSGFFPLSAHIEDFDGDNSKDVAEILGSSVAVLEGDGAGAFPGRLNFSAGTGPFALAVGDINRDGKPDIAVANSGSNDVSVLLNVSGP